MKKLLQLIFGKKNDPVKEWEDIQKIVSESNRKQQLKKYTKKYFKKDNYEWS